MRKRLDQNEAVTGLRERNKAKRRAAILDAATQLLREQVASEVTVDRIAELAEVSPATVYNLVGTREQLLLSLVDRLIDSLSAELAATDLVADSDDPFAPARLIVDRSVAVLVGDSRVFRQVIGSLGDFAVTSAFMETDPAQLQVAAIRNAQSLGAVRPDAAPEAIGRQIYLSYLGAAFAWTTGGLGDEGFALAARHGLLLAAAAVATDDRRDALLDELVEVGGHLVRAGWVEGAT